MNKKTVLTMLLAFISSLLLFTVTFIITFNFTMFNKKYILNTISKTNYTDAIYSDITMSINDIFTYSGIYNINIEKIIDKNDINSDIEKCIDSIFSGKKCTLNTKHLETSLENVITDYINTHELKVNNNNSIKAIIDECVTIYKKEIMLYNALDNSIYKFYKLKIILPCVSIIVIYLLIVMMVIIYKLNRNFIGTIFFTNAFLQLLFINIFKTNIDYQNILILSKEFSKSLDEVITNILFIFTIISIISFVIGFFIIILLNIPKKDCKISKKRVK